MNEAAAHDMQAIAATGCHVHGELNELLPNSEAFEDDQEPGHQVSQADILNAAIDALAATMQFERRAVLSCANESELSPTLVGDI